MSLKLILTLGLLPSRKNKKYYIYKYIYNIEWVNGWSRRFVAWVVCLLMGMGGLFMGAEMVK